MEYADDTVPSKRFIYEHLICHNEFFPENNCAIVGYTPMVAPNDKKPTIIQEWIERKQFAFQNLNHLKQASYNYFATCNLSLKTIFLLQYGMFDENYPLAAGEDIELGERLTEYGLKLYYNKNAQAKHIHPMPFKNYINRYVKMGKSKAYISQINDFNTVSFKSSKNKLSPFKDCSIFKKCIFFFLYTISVICTYWGYIKEKSK
mgnify:CR=1 FL=1